MGGCCALTGATGSLTSPQRANQGSRGCSRACRAAAVPRCQALPIHTPITGSALPVIEVCIGNIEVYIYITYLVAK